MGSFMKTLLLNIIIVLFAFSALGQRSDIDLLKYSYKKGNKDSLESFFSKWEKEYEQISVDQFNNLSDTLKDVYTIFTDFYTPLDLKRICSSEWGDSIYNSVDYVIVQNRIDFSIVSTLDKRKIILNYLEKNVKDSSKYEYYQNFFMKDTSSYTLGFIYYNSIKYLHEDSIMDFRPSLDFGNVGILFYKSKYTEIIGKFLKNKHYKLGIGGIMNPAKAKGKSKARLDWISSEIKIFYGHWGGYWQLTTYPRVNRIIFDEERKTALIFFRMIYEGGEALYKKIDNQWTLIDSKITWIE